MNKHFPCSKNSVDIRNKKKTVRLVRLKDPQTYHLFLSHII